MGSHAALSIHPDSTIVLQTNFSTRVESSSSNARHCLGIMIVLRVHHSLRRGLFRMEALTFFLLSGQRQRSFAKTDGDFVRLNDGSRTGSSRARRSLGAGG